MVILFILRQITIYLNEGKGVGRGFKGRDIGRRGQVMIICKGLNCVLKKLFDKRIIIDILEINNYRSNTPIQVIIGHGAQAYKVFKGFFFQSRHFLCFIFIISFLIVHLLYIIRDSFHRQSLATDKKKPNQFSIRLFC